MSTLGPSIVNALEVPPFPVRRFSVDEYHRMTKAGLLSEEDRVELLEGWIVPKMVHNPPHDATIGLIDEAIRPLLPAGWFLRIQSAMATGDSEPKPDLAVVAGTPRDFLSRHPGPGETTLVIEVDDSSLAKDRAKSRLYARAGIESYWIINLAAAVVEVSTDPRRSGETAAYRRHVVYGLDAVVPLVAGGREIGQIAVSDLLP